MSSFGTLFRVNTFGESHCKGVGCIVDGVPPGLKLTAEEDIQPQLTRRRPGQSRFATKRDEKDTVQILSGTENGVTLGTPIALLVMNEDQRPGDYKEMAEIPRPSHADLTYQWKYGVKAASGGGRASARETIGRVAAAGVAEKYLKVVFGVEIVAWVSRVGGVVASRELENDENIHRDEVDVNMIRCPDLTVAEEMMAVVDKVRNDQDSVGGHVTCIIRNVPAGLGEPCFDKLEVTAMLGHAMLSIPATKGFEFGSGFAGSAMFGSQHNDAFEMKPAKSNRIPERLGTKTNNSGGIQGGITNGENIVMRIAFKPPATIGQSQPTSNYDGEEVILQAKGRHDPCVVNRAVPIVESMAALVIMDAVMIQFARQNATVTLQYGPTHLLSHNLSPLLPITAPIAATVSNLNISQTPKINNNNHDVENNNNVNVNVNVNNLKKRIISVLGIALPFLILIGTKISS